MWLCPGDSRRVWGALVQNTEAKVHQTGYWPILKLKTSGKSRIEPWVVALRRHHGSRATVAVIPHLSPRATATSPA